MANMIYAAVSMLPILLSVMPLYRGYQAITRAGREGRADRGTLWRMTWLRICCVLVAIPSAIMGSLTPALVLSNWFPMIMVLRDPYIYLWMPAFFLWVPGVIVLYILAWRWL